MVGTMRFNQSVAAAGWNIPATLSFLSLCNNYQHYQSDMFHLTDLSKIPPQRPFQLKNSRAGSSVKEIATSEIWTKADFLYCCGREGSGSGCVSRLFILQCSSGLRPVTCSFKAVSKRTHECFSGTDSVSGDF